jgi:hypothetical protein
MKPVRSLLTVLITLLACAVAPAAASADARTWYVAPTGSDAAWGTATAPFATIGAALKRAQGGDRIQLADGSYAAPTDQTPRTGVVTVAGTGPDTTTVAGLNIYGGQSLTFASIRFTGPVKVQGHPMLHAAQPARDIVFDGDRFTYTGTCMMIREGARNIAVTDSTFTGCSTGINGPGNIYQSSGIRIERNTLSSLTADGIQFANWDNVRIVGNLIQSIRDPNGVIHNDGIQLTGGSTGVQLLANRIFDSNAQLIFVQDAVGPIDGITVARNVLAGAAAVALQSQGATHAVYDHNTIASAKDGGLWLAGGYTRNGTRVIPTDTVLTSNLSTTIRYLDGAVPATAYNNVVLCPAKYSGITVPGGATCVTSFGFVNPVARDYHLRADSPVRTVGSSVAGAYN